jgi:glycosyltransferase involved in cell wall biosynthesis
MSRKKLALVNVFFAPQAIGGATRVLMDNVDTLLADYSEEYDLVAFTSNHEMQEPHSIYTYLYNGVRVYRAGVIHRVNMDWHPRDEKMKDLFKEFLLFERPDIVHFHCIQRLSGSIVEAVLELEIPYVVTIHDAWWISDHQFLMDQYGIIYPTAHPDPFLPGALPDGVSLSDSMERRAYFRYLLSRASLIQVVSEAFANIYISNGIANVTVNRNGIQPRSWTPKANVTARKICVAHIGGMSDHKGYHLFKEALHNDSFKNLEALVVDHSASEDREVTERWGSVIVRFIRKVPQRKIETLFSQIDVLVAPSIWPESFGLVTREATAAGVWVICSNKGGIGEDVIEDHTGWVIEPTQENLLRAFQKLDQLARAPVPDKKAISSIRTVSDQVKHLDAGYSDILGR